MGLKLRLYTKGGAAVSRPHSHGSEGRAGTQCYVRGGGANDVMCKNVGSKWREYKTCMFLYF